MPKYRITVEFETSDPHSDALLTDEVLSDIELSMRTQLATLADDLDVDYHDVESKVEFQKTEWVDLQSRTRKR